MIVYVTILTLLTCSYQGDFLCGASEHIYQAAAAAAAAPAETIAATIVRPASNNRSKYDHVR